MTKLLLAPFAASAFAVVGSAQSFDLILPTHITVQGPTATCSGLSTGILVNTGDQELESSAWSELYHWSEGTLPLVCLAVRPSGSGMPSNLAPGEAIGKANDDMLALLDPSETYLGGEEEPLFALVGGDGEFTSVVTAVLHHGDQRVEFTLVVDVVDQLVPGFISASGAQRVSSESVPSPYGIAAEGCAFAGVELELSPHGQSNVYVPSTLGLESNLPYVGNHALELQLNDLPAELAGAPYLVRAGLLGPSAPYLGCELSLLSTTLASGVLFSKDDEAEAESVPVPLPDLPGWAGLDLAFQLGVVTPLADNGSFAASKTLRMTVGAP